MRKTRKDHHPEKVKKLSSRSFLKTLLSFQQDKLTTSQNARLSSLNLNIQTLQNKRATGSRNLLSFPSLHLFHSHEVALFQVRCLCQRGTWLKDPDVQPLVKQRTGRDSKWVHKASCAWSCVQSSTRCHAYKQALRLVLLLLQSEDSNHDSFVLCLSFL